MSARHIARGLLRIGQHSLKNSSSSARSTLQIRSTLSSTISARTLASLSIQPTYSQFLQPSSSLLSAVDCPMKISALTLAINESEVTTSDESEDDEDSYMGMIDFTGNQLVDW